MRRKPQFKIGDRVVLMTHGPHSSAKTGQVGTVLENSDAPWVEFDTPTGWGFSVVVETLDEFLDNDGTIPKHYADKGITDPMTAIGRAGYCDCVDQSWLQLFTEKES